MDFYKYYRALSRKDKTELRNNILIIIEIEQSTFYAKLAKESFKKLEKEKIAELLKKTESELFPKE